MLCAGGDGAHEGAGSDAEAVARVASSDSENGSAVITVGVAQASLGTGPFTLRKSEPPLRLPNCVASRNTGRPPLTRNETPSKPQATSRRPVHDPVYALITVS